MVDYSMIFESLRSREKTVEFFRKRGISWNKIVLFYLAKVYNENSMYIGPGHLSIL